MKIKCNVKKMGKKNNNRKANVFQLRTFNYSQYIFVSVVNILAEMHVQVSLVRVQRHH